jgi:hypothetical protein
MSVTHIWYGSERANRLFQQLLRALGGSELGLELEIRRLAAARSTSSELLRPGSFAFVDQVPGPAQL